MERAAQVHGTKEALGNSSGSLVPVEIDITQKGSIQSALKEISSKESMLHILVCNAGISSPTRTVEHGDEDAEKFAKELDQDTFDDWGATLHTNVTGHFFTTVAFIPLLAAASKQEHGLF